MNERGLVLVEQDSSHTAIGGIAWSHRYRCQAGAGIERRVPDAGDTIRDGDAGQAGAPSERIVPDAGDVGVERHAGQAGAGIERIVPDAGDAVGDRHAGQGGAVIERSVPDAGDAAGDRVGSGYASWVLNERGLVLVEQDSSHTAIGGIAWSHRYRCQAGAGIERIIPDVCDVGADDDVGQAGAGIERIGPDAGDRVAIG